MNFLPQTEVRVDLALPVNKLTKADIILVLCIVLVTVISVVFIAFCNTGEATGFEITVNGKLYATYSFSDLEDGEIIEIKTEYGYNKFLYKNKSIMCIETDCTDETELHAGSINKPNQVLICMPHKLTVHIIGKNSIDAVSY